MEQVSSENYDFEMEQLTIKAPP